MRKKVLIISCILIAVLLYTYLPQIGLHGQTATKLLRSEFIVVIDEGHGPVFGYREFIESLKFVNDSLYESNNIVLRVYTLNGEINSSSLTGIDLLMIPPTNGSERFTRDEASVISDYIRMGGSLLVLGAPFVVKTGEKTDLSVLNDLLYMMELDLGIEFYYEGGVGDLIRDDINGQGEVICINKEYASDDLSDLFSNMTDSLKVRTASLVIHRKEEILTMRTPPTAYRMDGDGNIYYNNSGYTVFASKEVRYGLVTVLGFGEVFTNTTGMNNKPWIAVQENMIFFTNLIRWLLRLDRWVTEEVQSIGPIYIYVLAGSIPFIVAYPYAIKMDKRREERIKKKKEEVKISEILKKMREEKK